MSQRDEVNAKVAAAMAGPFSGYDAVRHAIMVVYDELSAETMKPKPAVDRIDSLRFKPVYIIQKDANPELAESDAERGLCESQTLFYRGQVDAWITRAESAERGLQIAVEGLKKIMDGVEYKSHAWRLCQSKLSEIDKIGTGGVDSGNEVKRRADGGVAHAVDARTPPDLDLAKVRAMTDKANYYEYQRGYIADERVVTDSLLAEKDREIARLKACCEKEFADAEKWSNECAFLKSQNAEQSKNMDAVMKQLAEAQQNHPQNK